LDAIIPKWLLETQSNSPRPAKPFMNKNIHSFLRLLSMARARESMRVRIRFNPPLKLASVLFLIILISISRIPLFTIVSGTLLLAILSLCRAELIVRVLRISLPAAVTCLLVMIPSALWGNLGGAAVIAAKVFISVSAVTLLSVSTSWAELSRGLKVFLPRIFIQVLDLTQRYIFKLGEISLEMLYALELRSVGWDRNRMASLSGIAGTLFLKSKEAAEDTRCAMECRCFSGSYRPGSAPVLLASDSLLFLLDGALVAGFCLIGA
jgi:cobalt/nickel transport system permease protein